MTSEILYFGDPMCSWCWGFAPVLEKIREACAGKVPVTLVMGGLRVTGTQPMPEELKATLQQHWEEVAEQTGQPFDFGFFAREGFVYNTEPPCRAVVAMRGHLASIAPDDTISIFRYYESIQRAFYAENKDVTHVEVLAELAAPFGVKEDVFIEQFRSQEIRRLTHVDFVQAMEGGIRGFPTMVLKKDIGGQPNFRLLTIGYQSYTALEADLSEWLEEEKSS